MSVVRANNDLDLPTSVLRRSIDRRKCTNLDLTGAIHSDAVQVLDCFDGAARFVEYYCGLSSADSVGAISKEDSLDRSN